MEQMDCEKNCFLFSYAMSQSSGHMTDGKQQQERGDTENTWIEERVTENEVQCLVCARHESAK